MFLPDSSMGQEDMKSIFGICVDVEGFSLCRLKGTGKAISSACWLVVCASTTLASDTMAEPALLAPSCKKELPCEYQVWIAWGNAASYICEGWGNSSSKVSVQEWDKEWLVFGWGRRLEILRGRHDWKVSVGSSIRATWRERTLEGDTVYKPLYVRSCDKLWEEKTVIGDPKLSFVDSQIRSSVAAKVRI